VNILKKIFIGLGIIFTILIVIFGLVVLKSWDFKKDNTEFVKQFMTQFADNWEMNDVQHMLTNEFIDQITTPGGRAAVMEFRKLGKLVDILDIELNNFNTFWGTNSQQRGVFVFKAQFENGNALATLTLIVNDNGRRVDSLNLNPIGEIDFHQRDTKIKT
jgi:hypothetical protein